MPEPNTNDVQEPAAAKPGRQRKFRLRIITRGALVRLALVAAALAIFCLWAYFVMTRMPGKTYTGPLPPLTDEHLSLRDELIRDVQKLATEIGERNVWTYPRLAAAADFIEAELTKAGYKPRRQNFKAVGRTCCNIEVEITGSTQPDEIIIIGAHYDTVPESPGANDNASGVAAALALARRFANQTPARTLRFVFFA
ncbi:MAG: M28 family peptidase, partial [Planctomycetota bacterium]